MRIITGTLFFLICVSCLRSAELYPMEQLVFTKINKVRTNYGLQPLVISENLQKSARKHCVWMCYHGLIHSSGNFAENIAVGYPNSDSVIRGWMSSSGHRANILGRYRKTGITAYQYKGRIFWCQQFK